MFHFRRGEVKNQSVIPAPREAVWALISDWGGAKKLETPQSAAGPFALESVDLIGDPAATPRTRVFHFKGDMPKTAETLLHEDAQCFHLFYKIDGEGPLGIQNYLAVMDVDAVDENECTLSIWARFDVPDAVAVEDAQGMVSAIHASIFEGLTYRVNADL